MTEVNGLIQHSFALQLAPRRSRFRGRSVLDRVAERFELPHGEGKDGKFSVKPLCKAVECNGDLLAAVHSPLGEHQMTTVGSRQLKYLKYRNNPTKPPLPPAFRWAENNLRECLDEYSEPRLIFTDKFEDERRDTINDFLVRAPSPASPDEAVAISLTLLELMAHKRSRLFGFPLANRFVNVMLPHAVLHPLDTTGGTGPWFMQPLVSFIRGGHDRARLRQTYSLSFFLVPVAENGCLFGERKVSEAEIKQVINLGWALSVAPAGRAANFEVSGPLLGYLSSLARHDICGKNLDRRCTPSTSALSMKPGGFTLRQAIERIAFGVGLSMAQGRSSTVTLRAAQLIGNDVLTALGSARVSSVVVVDPNLTANEVKAPRKNPAPYPGILEPLMETLSGRIRAPRYGDGEARKYRLDRPFVDDDIYAAGVLPVRRCIIVVSRGCAQWGSRESALMQAGSIAYMTLGAATAIGTLRDIDRRLEALEGADDPLKIAKIDAEVAADLGEIYDLDIRGESYREFYRRLRIRLGISRDYTILQDKMQALYRATSTAHEHKAEQRLTWLTAAIVILSAFILIGTLVLAGKGG